MTSKTEIVADPGSPRIQMRRIVDAPRELVFDAFTKPELVTRWKGPRDLKVTLIEVDLRPGGKWRINYRLPNGGDMGFYGEYSEVVRPEKIVRTFCFEGKPGKLIESIVFEALGEKTNILTTTDYESVEARDATLKSMGPGMGDAYDRLDELLLTLEG
jgi:uncharacterized protein YndB with AHSA1/START domain